MIDLLNVILFWINCLNPERHIGNLKNYTALLPCPNGNRVDVFIFNTRNTSLNDVLFIGGSHD